MSEDPRAVIMELHRRADRRGDRADSALDYRAASALSSLLDENRTLAGDFETASEGRDYWLYRALKAEADNERLKRFDWLKDCKSQVARAEKAEAEVAALRAVVNAVREWNVDSNGNPAWLDLDAILSSVPAGDVATFPRDWTCGTHGNSCPKQGLDWDCCKEDTHEPHEFCDPRLGCIGGMTND